MRLPARRSRHRPRRLVALLALVLAWTATPTPAAQAQDAAQAGDLYTLAGIEVDVTGDSAAEARDQALAEAHRKAFQRLVTRLVPRGAQGQVPDLSYDNLGGLVRSFEVNDERSSSVRYLATLTFHFQPQAVRTLLRRHDVPFAETQSKPVLVLPLFGAAGDAVLWDDPNPWRDAWSARGPDSGLVPLTLPLGDLGDLRAITAEDALNQDLDALRAIARRYDAGDVLVAQAIPAREREGAPASAQIITRRISPDGQSGTWIDNVRQRDGETRGAMYARAAERVAREVENTWKLSNVLRFDSESRMRVAVPIRALEDWAVLRRRLQTVPLVDSSQVLRLSRQQAELELVYYGDRRQLRRALAQSDLMLRERSAGNAGTDNGGSAPAMSLVLAGTAPADAEAEAPSP